MDDLQNELSDLIAQHLNAGLSTTELGVVLQTLIGLGPQAQDLQDEMANVIDRYLNAGKTGVGEVLQSLVREWDADSAADEENENEG